MWLSAIEERSFFCGGPGSTLAVTSEAVRGEAAVACCTEELLLLLYKFASLCHTLPLLLLLPLPLQ
jgi:hypothetical protein